MKISMLAPLFLRVFRSFNATVPRSRRFSCLVYARNEVPVRSAVPDEERPKQRPPHPDDAKRRGAARDGERQRVGLVGLEEIHRKMVV